AMGTSWRAMDCMAAAPRSSWWTDRTFADPRSRGVPWSAGESPAARGVQRLAPAREAVGRGGEALARRAGPPLGIGDPGVRLVGGRMPGGRQGDVLDRDADVVQVATGAHQVAGARG